MENELIIKQLITAWDGKVAQAEKLFDKLGATAPNHLIVPGGNSVLYLIGHLTVVSDRLLEAMNLEERVCPEWDALFLEAFNPQTVYPAYERVRENWDQVKEKLDTHFNRMDVADWLTPHHYVSEEDFKKEPQRNVLNILISRTAHLANHIGQLLLVK